MSFISDKLAIPSLLNTRLKICFKSFFGSISMQKTVSETLKTWYFPYSALLSANQFGRPQPFPPTPPDYATHSGEVLQ